MTHPLIPLDARTGRFGKEPSLGVLAKLMHQLVETTQGVPKSSGDFGPGKSFHEIGPQGFVLPMVGVLRSEQDSGQVH